MNITFTKMSWQEFADYCDDLFKQIWQYLEETGQHVDLIVPLLREGGFVGLNLAYKLNTWKVLPLCSKKFEKNGTYPIKLLTPVAKPLFDLPEKPLILMVDVLTLSGITATWARKQLQKTFPKAQFLYASILDNFTTVYDKQFVKTFHCITGDDANQLTKREAKKRNIDKNVYLFPWQNEEEELAGILREEFEYY